MIQVLANPYRGTGLPSSPDAVELLPSTDSGAVAHLLAQCPKHTITPLLDAPEIAAQAGVGWVHIKDESARMGLGSFKALGAAYAIARDAQKADAPDWATALTGRVYVSASAGNHGMSVAAGARVFGALAVIYLAQSVPEAFADRLRAMGAKVVREGTVYEESMAAAEKAARDNDWQLLSDSSWPGYTNFPRDVMEGYLQLIAEVADVIDQPPSHIFLQAGVGGMAAAVAAFARKVWGDVPNIIVVEPDAAPALFESIRAGHLVDTKGPVSDMGRLDCKTASMVALNGLARDADLFVTLTEEDALNGVVILEQHGYGTTTSGGAGLAALLAGVPGCGADARVLCIMSEGREDG